MIPNVLKRKLPDGVLTFDIQGSPPVQYAMIPMKPVPLPKEVQAAIHGSNMHISLFECQGTDKIKLLPNANAVQAGELAVEGDMAKVELVRETKDRYGAQTSEYYNPETMTSLPADLCAPDTELHGVLRIGKQLFLTTATDGLKHVLGYRRNLKQLVCRMEHSALFGEYVSPAGSNPGVKRLESEDVRRDYLKRLLDGGRIRDGDDLRNFARKLPFAIRGPLGPPPANAPKSISF